MRLGPLDELPEGGSRGYTVASGEGPLRIFAVRRAGRVYGYVNRCPHVGTPLDWLEHEFLDREGRHVVCATHGALFRIEDGVCIAGPCQGDQLEPWPVEVRDGELWAASATLADAADV